MSVCGAKRRIRGLAWVTEPVKREAVFFVFMTLLAAGSFLTHFGTLRNTLFFCELWVDLYSLTLILCLLPRRVAGVARAGCSAIAYILAVIDAYCSVRFGAGISPTMLQLVTETTTTEAGDFFEGYVFRVETLQAVWWIAVLGTGHLFFRRRKWRESVIGSLYRIGGRAHYAVGRFLRPSFRAGWHISVGWVSPFRRNEWYGLICAVCLSVCMAVTMPVRLTRLGIFRQPSVLSLERYLTGTVSASLYTPVHRLAFSIFTHSLSGRDLERLQASVERTCVDSCSYRSPNIVLVIGESYNKSHSQLYGYGVPTTPRQLARQKCGELFVFTDVVTSWNITSQVFKNMLSLHSTDQPGSWTDATLFPAVFRRAGYRVAFLTNQFAPSVDEDIFGFSGSFFLNAPELSRELFDWRNRRAYRYDDALLACYDAQRRLEAERNLTVFHLWGQHMLYHHRMPSRRRILKAKDEPRPELSAKDRQWVANYDNATLFNDSVVDAILTRFEDREVVVVYVSDHGEEVYDELPEFGRNPDRDPTPPVARAEYEVPFWIWCSPVYRERHPDVVSQIRAAVERPFMTDDLSHMLLWLGGIACPGYEPSRNVLDANFDAGRKRLLRGRYDYDVMKTADR